MAEPILELPSEQGYFLLAGEKGIAVQALSESSFELWPPAECPLCRQGVPLRRRIQAA